MQALRSCKLTTGEYVKKNALSDGVGAQVVFEHLPKLEDSVVDSCLKPIDRSQQSRHKAYKQQHISVSSPGNPVCAFLAATGPDLVSEQSGQSSFKR